MEHSGVAPEGYGPQQHPMGSCEEHLIKLDGVGVQKKHQHEGGVMEVAIVDHKEMPCGEIIGDEAKEEEGT